MDKKCSRGKVVIIGSGRSGRGLHGDFCYREEYDLTFADIDLELIKKLQKNKKYTSFTEKENGSGFSARVIDGFHAYHIEKDREAYIEALAEADIIFTATFDDAFPSIIRDIKESLRLRMSKERDSQFLLVVGANYIGLYDYFSKAFTETFSKTEQEYFDRYGVLAEAVIYRVSSWPNTEQRAQDELSVQSDSFDVLWVNTGHVQKADKVRLPAFFENMDDTLQFMHCKIWNVNTSHCSLAYMGQYYGYENVCDAANDDMIRRLAYFASKEAYAGLAKRYHLPDEQDKKSVEELWKWYCGRTMKDSVIRVGNDPSRKLRRNDRFIGAALNALDYVILPVHICQNAAYGFYFHNEGDPRSDKMHEMIRTLGIEQTIKKICGLDPEKNEKEKLVYDLILAKYYDLAKENPVDKYLI